MKPVRTSFAVLRYLVLMVLSGLLAEAAPAADLFSETFDGANASWEVNFNRTQLGLVTHRRHEGIKVDGRAAEHFVLESLQPGAVAQFGHPLPPARVIDDLQLTVWVRSNRPGAILWLRAVLPHQLDPRHDRPAEVYFEGGRYTGPPGEWQQLTCATPEKQKLSRLAMLRSLMKQSQVDTREMYVDRAVITSQFDVGTVEMFVDELRFGPIVEPASDAVVLAGAEAATRQNQVVELRHDRLIVKDRPFLPRMTPYHGEELGLLKQTGFNVVWIPELTDRGLLNGLREQDLWATATPPNPVSPSGNVLQAKEAGFLPFTAETAPILFWNLGTRLPGDSHKFLLSWASQVRNADRDFRRPIFADVVGNERDISRDISMLSMSRHALNTSFTLKQNRDWLIEHRHSAVPGIFPMTWIPTEPANANVDWRKRLRRAPVVIEPEQIFLHTYAALAAGCRGIGFWKRTSLEADAPGAQERRLAITLLNRELDLLEPWLATSNSNVWQIPFEAAAADGDSRRQSGKTDGAPKPKYEGQLEAVVIHSGDTLVLLPVWYEDGSQFVPSAMVADDVQITVPFHETAAAWEVTTTGVRSLFQPRGRGPGGTRIKLDHFELGTAIVLTTDPEIKPALERSIAAMAEGNARAWIDLATAKRNRVKAVVEQLQSVAVDNLDSESVLAAADRYLASAEQSLQSGAFNEARLRSSQALKLLRYVQYRHWRFAVRKLSSPVSSPYTVSFQTLPDHYQMLARLGRSRASMDGNLLRSGDFEDEDTMRVEEWEHSQSYIDGVRAGAELVRAGRDGKYCLRLWAAPVPGHQLAGGLANSPVTVRTPPLPVRSGQIVHISGWVQVVAPVTGSLDGAMLYDSLLGPVGALRWRETGKWQRFDLIREVQESGDFSISMVLRGMGDIRFDDLRVVPHDPQPDAQFAGHSKQVPQDSDSTRRGPFKFLERLPKLSPLRRN